MRFLVLDFESFYADDYTLSKMTAEEYIRDDRFEIIGVSFAYLGEKPQWYSGDLDYIKSVLHQIPWHDTFVIGHNMSAFDSLILTEVCGVRPAYFGCTLQLARRLHGGKVSNALGSLAKMYNLGMDKGDEVVHAKGKRRLDFTPHELARYGAYCDKDVILCGLLWQQLSPKFPKSELYIAHLCTKIWAEPRLLLDTPLLEAMGKELAVRKAALLGDVANMLGVGTTMPQAERMFHTQKLLRSDAKFAELLRSYDVEVPMKRSPKKRDAEGKAMLVYAFAKTDDGMQELTEYEESEDENVNLAVQSLAAARLGTKSTIAESRVERFRGISLRGSLPVPYTYGKSHCDRYAGAMKINMQNMNRNKAITPKTPNGSLIMTPGGWSTLFKRQLGRDPRTNRVVVTAVMDENQRVWKAKECHVVGLRDAIVVPKGYLLVVADSSNIELRTCHHLCGEVESIELLRRGEDLYCDFATSFYGRTITKADEQERQHGKTAELQLQFQAGAESFRRSARIQSGMRLTELEAQTTVDVYRAKRQAIKGMWNQGQRAIPRMASGGGFDLDKWGFLHVEHNAILLPNGMRMEYHDLRQEEMVNYDGEKEVNWVFTDKEDRKMKKLYGGKVIQNGTQILARNVVFEQKIEIERELGSYDRYGEGIVMSTHDEPVALVREDRAEEALKFMLEVMSRSPKWWPSLPVKAEGDIADRYSLAK